MLSIVHGPQAIGSKGGLRLAEAATATDQSDDREALRKLRQRPTNQGLGPEMIFL